MPIIYSYCKKCDDKYFTTTEILYICTNCYTVNTREESNLSVNKPNYFPRLRRKEKIKKLLDNN